MRNNKKLTVITVIVVIFIILLLSVAYNLRYSPEVNQFYRFLFGERTISGEVVPLDGGVQYRATTYMDTVALTGGGEMMFIKKDGKLTGDHPLLSMSAPILSSSGKYLIVGDTAGDNAVIFANKKKVLSKQTEGTISSVRINSNGYFLIISEEKGYKGMISVYAPSGDEIYKWHSGDRNILDADVDYDGSSFKVALLDTEGLNTGGMILFFQTNQADPIHEIHSDSNLFCRLQCNRDHSLTALGDTGMVKYSPSGQELWSVNFENQTLLSADISSVDRLVLMLTADEADGIGGSCLSVYNRNGKEKNTVAIEGQPDGMSVYDDTALILENPKIYVADVYGSGVLESSLGKDLKFISIFRNENRALAVSSGGYEILKIR